MPPLRQRRADVPLLVEHFLGVRGRPGSGLRFAPDAMARLFEYGWPGNIRELRNLIERLHILHEGHEVRAGDLPAEFHSAGGRPRTAPSATGPPAAGGRRGVTPLAEIERRHVERVLQATGWNKARAARVLEVDIKTLNKKIRDFQIARHVAGRLSRDSPGRSSHPSSVADSPSLIIPRLARSAGVALSLP